MTTLKLGNVEMETGSKLRYEDLASIGQTIRGYDFRSCKDRFIQGKVIAKGWVKHPEHNVNMFTGYTIEIDEEGAENSGERVGDIGYVPFQVGFEWDDRVEIID
tara:strand:+ start:158 stop:469 length:312 start_codon:yes stop_codon:yes gene_type:complete